MAAELDKLAKDFERAGWKPAANILRRVKQGLVESELIDEHLPSQEDVKASSGPPPRIAPYENVVMDISLQSPDRNNSGWLKPEKAGEE